MAEGKKSVLLYCDLIHTVEPLTDEEAGKLFKHYLRYINDQNPCSEDRLITLLFEPIKQNLKRDLKKWESKSVKNKEIAIAGWEKRKNANAYESIKDDANNADTVTVKDTVKVKDIIKKKINKGVAIYFKDSEFADKVKFKEKFPNWQKDKLAFYYDLALTWSNEGNKKIDWIAAVRTWAKRDELQGKLKFSQPDTKRTEAPDYQAFIKG